MPFASPMALLNPVSTALVGRVRALFNDLGRGEKPVPRSRHGLYPPGSVIWRVHGDVTTMMVGGVAALLLQMLHPKALAGVLDHSGFRADMLGRLRRTARFIAVTTYGERDTAEAAIARVRAIHARVSGKMADGSTYSATDPGLLAWVHVAEAICFLDAWRRFGEPDMSVSDQDRYFVQFAEIARRLGAAPVPESRDEAEALLRAMRPELRGSDHARETAELLLSQRLGGRAIQPMEKMLAQSAVDLLPHWACDMLGLERSRLARPAVHAGTFATAATLRWAFRSVAAAN